MAWVPINQVVLDGMILATMISSADAKLDRSEAMAAIAAAAGLSMSPHPQDRPISLASFPTPVGQPCHPTRVQFIHQLQSQLLPPSVELD